MFLMQITATTVPKESAVTEKLILLPRNLNQDIRDFQKIIIQEMRLEV